MDLSKLIEDFLEYLEIEKNVSKLTIRNYRHYLNRFLAFLTGYPLSPDGAGSLSGGQDVQPHDARDSTAAPSKIILKKINPAEITADRIHQYRLYLARYVDEHGISLKRITQNYHLIAIRSFLKFCLKRDITVIAPEKIDLPKAESRSIKFLEREQVERLLSMPSLSEKEGYRDKAIMETLFSTGLRVSELVSLNRDQINFERKEFGVIGKGRRSRLVFLSDAAVEWIRKYLANRDDDSPALFIRYAGKTPDIENKNTLRLTARSVQRMIEKYVRKARLPVKITPHGLRHSFATDLLTNGADLRAIQEMLGHKNVSTTQIYTHVTNPQLRSIHEKFHRKTSE